MKTYHVTPPHSFSLRARLTHVGLVLSLLHEEKPVCQFAGDFDAVEVLRGLLAQGPRPLLLMGDEREDGMVVASVGLAISPEEAHATFHVDSGASLDGGHDEDEPWQASVPAFGDASGESEGIRNNGWHLFVHLGTVMRYPSDRRYPSGSSGLPSEELEDLAGRLLGEGGRDPMEAFLKDNLSRYGRGTEEPGAPS